MGNIRSASGLIEQLRAAGVGEFCVCAGSRNAPLLAVLGATGVKTWSFVDERSAAFFALGRWKLHGAPVAVVTTSGTAVAELLPAAVEAYYSGAALVFVTADRPARFRGTGAPQSIEQVGIFGPYAETALETWSRTVALHLNIEFDEPLIDEPVPAGDRVPAAPPAVAPAEAGVTASGDPDLGQMARPLVIIGGLAPLHRARVRSFALSLGAPVFAEPLSGLREDTALPLITSGERMIARGRFDGVIRIGNIPTLRFWRDLETLDLPVVHYSDLPFPGLTRGEIHPIASLPAVASSRTRDDPFFSQDAEQAEKLSLILDAEPTSELSLVRGLSRELSNGARIYLGNSLPIREWDLVARRDLVATFAANRGANGIDGQLSTFFGQCDPARENLCLLGDLTTIYDLGAPWIVRQLDGVRFRIVIINNGGGRIFSRVQSLRSLDPAVRENLVENGHDVQFDHWVSMWRLEGRVTELRPDAESSARAWKRYEELWV